MSEERYQSEQKANEERPNQVARSSFLHGDGIAGAVVLAFCAAVVYITTTFEEVPAILSQGIPPTQFPRMMIGIIAFLTVVMMIQSQNRRDKGKKPVPIVAFMTAGFLLLFVAAIEWIGTIGAIVIFCIALPILWGERRYRWLAAYALVFPAGVYLLFVKVLEVRFPAGLFESFFG